MHILMQMAVGYTNQESAGTLTVLQVECNIVIDIRDFAKVSNVTELKNLTLLQNSVPIALSVFMVVDSQICNTSLSNFIMFH